MTIRGNLADALRPPERRNSSMGENPSDSVQLYLTQMGSSRLLSRQEEYEAARRIEHARKNFRRAILSADYVLQAAVGMLEKVLLGRMRLETVCEGPFSSEQRKRRLAALLRPERANAASAVEAEPRRFFGGRVEANAGRTSPPDPPTHVPAPSEGHPSGRGIAGSPATSAAGVGAAPRNQPSHGRRPSRVAATARRRRSSPSKGSAQRVAPPHAGHAGDARHAAPPAWPASPSSNTRTKSPARNSRPQTCGWSSRSPSAIETAASASSI